MQMFQVGKPYSETRSTWPETAEYNYWTERHELRIFYNAPRPAEIQAIQAGRAAFALATYLDVIFLPINSAICPGRIAAFHGT